MSEPYTKSSTVPRSDEEIAELEFTSAFAEAANNGQAIDWKYWARLAKWSAGEAARLMCALDPDVFESLDARPNNNDSAGPALKAKKIQRLAERDGFNIATPKEWIVWADGHGLQIHEGLRIETENVDEAAPIGIIALSDKSPKELRSAIDPKSKRGAPRRILEEWDAIEEEYGPTADATQVLRVLSRNKDEKTPSKKTVQNILWEFRRDKLIP